MKYLIWHLEDIGSELFDVGHPKGLDELHAEGVIDPTVIVDVEDHRLRLLLVKLEEPVAFEEDSVDYDQSAKSHFG